MFAGLGLLVLITIWVASAVVASNIASAKGLDVWGWSLAAFFFGPIGLIGVAGMPDRRLRQYMKSIAIKLEAVQEKEAERMEMLSLPAPLRGDKPNYLYADEGIKDEQERIKVVINQLTESEEALASAADSELKSGRMGFIRGKDGKVMLRLRYVGSKDGKDIWYRA